MQEPVPKGIKVVQGSEEAIKQPVMVDQHRLQTEQKIATALNKAGIQSTPQSVSADHSHVLKGIEEFGGEVLHDTQALFEATKGEIGGGATYVRMARLGNVTDIIRERQQKGGRIVSLLNKLGWKKAA